MLKPLVVALVGLAAIRYVVATWAESKSAPRVVVALLVAAIVTWAVPNHRRILDEFVQPDVEHYVDEKGPILPPRVEGGRR